MEIYFVLRIIHIEYLFQSHLLNLAKRYWFFFVLTNKITNIWEFKNWKLIENVFYLDFMDI